MRLVLCGFMGSGKTTVGRLVAERLQWRFVDLDMLIEARTGSTVSQIFAGRGEAAFREQEAGALREALDLSEVVIALGGGTPEAEANRALLLGSPGTFIAYLHAPFAVLHDRCTRQAAGTGAATRPLLANREHAEARYAARAPLYAQIAHITLAAGSVVAKDIVQSILGAFPAGPAA